MSCPLHTCCNKDPGLNAESLAASVGGLDATGQSLGNGLARLTMVGRSTFKGLLEWDFLVGAAFLAFLADVDLEVGAMFVVHTQKHHQSQKALSTTSNR